MFAKMLARFPNYIVGETPPPTLIAHYQTLVPAEMLEVWTQFGFGTLCNGYLRVVNPADYEEILADSYQLTSTDESEHPIVLFATAMGDLLIWEMGYLSLVNYRHGQVSIITKNIKLFFRNLPEDFYLRETLRWEPYPAAREKFGEPAYDECFGYVPLLALGGVEDVAHLQKVKLREHIDLIAAFTGVLER